MIGKRATFVLSITALLGLGPTGCPKRSSSTDAGPQCKTTADCTGGQVCVSGSCSTCTLDSQCQEIARDMQCNVGTQLCGLIHCFGNDCMLNSDCSLGDFCVQGLCLDPRNQQTGPDACTVVTCTKDADCSTGQICDTTNGVCVLNLGCSSNADCPMGQNCNVGLATCQAACTAATAYEICGVVEQCFNGVCVQCISNSDCGTGLTCDLTTNECVGFDGCMSDADCEPPLVCNPLTNQCTQPLPPCTGNENCPPGEACQEETGTCISATCVPDQYAPNQSLATAAPITPGPLENLTLCNLEASYFSLPLQNGDILSVVINTQFALLPLDVAVLDVTGAVLAESSDLALQTTAPEDGTFIIRTESSDSYVNYGMTVSVTQGTPCHPYPPSNTYATAVRTAIGNLLEYCDSDAGPCGPPTVCPGGQDWFVTGVTSGQQLTVTLETTASNGPLDIYLYDSNGMRLLDSSTQAADSQSVSSSSFSGRSAYIEVVPDQPGTGNSYSLTLSSP